MEPLWGEIARQGPFVAVLVFFLWGFIKDPPWWVTGREYRAKSQSHDEYKVLAFQLLKVAEKAVKP